MENQNNTGESKEVRGKVDALYTKLNEFCDQEISGFTEHNLENPREGRYYSSGDNAWASLALLSDRRRCTRRSLHQ